MELKKIKISYKFAAYQEFKDMYYECSSNAEVESVNRTIENARNYYKKFGVEDFYLSEVESDNPVIDGIFKTRFSNNSSCTFKEGVLDKLEKCKYILDKNALIGMSIGLPQEKWDKIIHWTTRDPDDVADPMLERIIWETYTPSIQIEKWLIELFEMAPIDLKNKFVEEVLGFKVIWLGNNYYYYRVRE